jgi:phosphinothricin acetyltransferase
MKLRLANAADAAALAAIYRPYVEHSISSFELTPPDEAELRRRLSSTLETFPWLVGDLGGQVVGYAYASQHRERAAYAHAVDVSVYVDARAHRGGLARRLYTALFTLLEAQHFHMAFAGISLPNEPSERFHAAMGFEPVGVYREAGWKFGAWRDVAWSQRPLSTTTPPQPIVPFPRLDPAVIAAALL